MQQQCCDYNHSLRHRSAALNCTTTFAPCYSTGPPPGTHWYFPNGGRVSNTNTLPYYRTRIDVNRSPEPGTVLLHRNPEGTTTGVFRCEILDASGTLQSLYVGIYTAYPGESCTLKSNKLICGRAHVHECNDNHSACAEHEQQPFFPNDEFILWMKWLLNFNAETSSSAVSSPLLNPLLIEYHTVMS